ncbi:NAD-dependent epimerase/dehydratase family protein [Vibrio mediterranei]
MKKYLVTGTSGRVGSLVAKSLLSEGKYVIGLDLKDSIIEHELYSHVTTDFTDIDVLNNAMGSVDIVLHLGAMMSWHPNDSTKMYSANVTATQLLLESAVQVKIERFVFASSGEVYPETNAEFLPVNEQHPRNPTSFYGLTKKLAEELVMFYQSRGLETCILRFPHTQSKEEIIDPTSFFSGARFFLSGKIAQMEYFGNEAVASMLRELENDEEQVIVMHGKEDELPFMMHIADVRDTVSGVILAADHPKAANEIFNLGPDDVVEFNKCVPAIAEKLGLKAINVYMPGNAMRFMTSNAKIKALLGYQPKHTFLKMVEEA